MRPFHAAAAVLLLLRPGPADGLTTAYTEDLVLVQQNESTLEQTIRRTVVLDGIEVTVKGGDDIVVSFHRSRTQTDHFLEVDDGRPVKLRRVFGEISQDRNIALGKSGDENEETMTGVVEGLTLLIEVDEDDQTTATVEDGEVEDRYLEHFLVSYETDLLAPPGEAEEGDSWELGTEALERLFGLLPSPTYFEPDREQGEVDIEEVFREATREAAELEGEVTWNATEERDGLSCALLTFEMSMETSDFDASAFAPAMFGMRDDVALEDATAQVVFETEGSFWFAIEKERPVALKSEGEGTVTLSVHTASPHDGDRTVTFGLEIEQEESGTDTWSAPYDED